MSDRDLRRAPSEPARKLGDDTGPKQPDVKRPGNDELLRRLKKVDPDQAKKYRQRSGQ